MRLHNHPEDPRLHSLPSQRRSEHLETLLVLTGVEEDEFLADNESDDRVEERCVQVRDEKLDEVTIVCHQLRNKLAEATDDVDQSWNIVRFKLHQMLGKQVSHLCLFVNCSTELLINISDLRIIQLGHRVEEKMSSERIKTVIESSKK